MNWLISRLILESSLWVCCDFY